MVAVAIESVEVGLGCLLKLSGKVFDDFIERRLALDAILVDTLLWPQFWPRR